MVGPDKPAIPEQWLFQACSSHQQGIHITCLAHHPGLYTQGEPCTAYLESLDHPLFHLHGDGEVLHEAARQEARVEPLKHVFVVNVAKHGYLVWRGVEGGREGGRGDRGREGGREGRRGGKETAF